ncbi:MAG: TetR/AcrR family transcriptional regulator, partial [Thermoleophilia bacterium]|nr:TetR/AcrR family transcriptional regulator [Gaiellaceae bacterium]MDW8338857.1 TetR/AcrR family transcriptional regulator [Thermoleophilia bacterium]
PCAIVNVESERASWARGRTTAGDRRTRILDATCRVIARHGVRGLRVERVAEEAGTSVSLIYYYFGSRRGLVRATLEHANARAPSGHPLEFGERAGYEVVREALLAEISDDAATIENSSVWGEVLATSAFDARLRPTVRSAVEAWVQSVASAIRTGIEDGSVRPDVDPARAAQHLTALVEGLSDRWLAGALTTAEARAVLDEAISGVLGPLPPGPQRAGAGAGRRSGTSASRTR